MTTSARLDAFGIVVVDLKRAVDFYRVLGAPFPEGAEASEHGHAEATLAGGVRFMIDTEASVKTFNPDWRRAAGMSGASLAFHCSGGNDVDAIYELAIAAGGRRVKDPWNAFWGQRYALLSDPDGNPVDLYAELGA